MFRRTPLLFSRLISITGLKQRSELKNYLATQKYASSRLFKNSNKVIIKRHFGFNFENEFNPKIDYIKLISAGFTLNFSDHWRLFITPNLHCMKVSINLPYQKLNPQHMQQFSYLIKETVRQQHLYNRSKGMCISTIHYSWPWNQSPWIDFTHNNVIEPKIKVENNRTLSHSLMLPLDVLYQLKLLKKKDWLAANKHIETTQSNLAHVSSELPKWNH